MIMRIENEGFTVIELVTVILVLSILGAFTLSFIGNAVKTYGLVREQNPLYADGTSIMERVTRELSDATAINTADVPQYPSWSSKLTFTTAAHPPPPLTAVRPAASVTYELNNTNLLRNGTIIGRNITGFNVTRSSLIDATVTIELTLNSPSDPSIPAFVLRTKVVPNNYPGDYTGRSFNGDYYETVQ